MLPRRSRLDHLRVANALSVGKRLHTPLFSLLYTAAPDARAAVVVGRRVAGGAARNRLRRRFYAALRGGLPVTGHLVVIAKPPAATASYEELETGLREALLRLLGDRPRSR